MKRNSKKFRPPNTYDVRIMMIWAFLFAAIGFATILLVAAAPPADHPMIVTSAETQPSRNESPADNTGSELSPALITRRNILIAGGAMTVALTGATLFTMVFPSDKLSRKNQTTAHPTDQLL